MKKKRKVFVKKDFDDVGIISISIVYYPDGTLMIGMCIICSKQFTYLIPNKPKPNCGCNRKEKIKKILNERK